MKTRIFFVACGLSILAGCSKSSTESAPSAPGASAPVAAVAGRPARDAKDFKTPYLTEEKLAKFIESSSEADNPLYLVFAESGGAVDIAKVKERMDELNALARKWGFADYEDYVQVWGRVLVAETILMTEEMQASTSGMFTKMIENAERELKKPDLTPEMRKMYEEQLAGARKSLEEMKKKSDLPLNSADFELIKAHRAEVQQAVKKYKKHKG